MNNEETPDDLKKFQIECELNFLMMTDEELVKSHNSACGIPAYNRKVGIIISCRKSEFLKRGIDAALIIKGQGEVGLDYSLRKCGVWITIINGRKTLAGTEIDLEASIEKPQPKFHSN